MKAVPPIQSGREPADAPYEQLPAVNAHFQGRASREGAEFDEFALDHLEAAGAEILERGGRFAGYPIDGLITAPNGLRFVVAAHGTFDDGPQSGIRRTDTLHKVAHRAVMLHWRGSPPLIVVSSQLPLPATTAGRYLADLHEFLGPWLWDVVATTGDLAGFNRLHRGFNTRPAPSAPDPAPWWHSGDTQLDLFTPNLSGPSEPEPSSPSPTPPTSPPEEHDHA